jgi:A/G-specific adenine glycosylase
MLTPEIHHFQKLVQDYYRDHGRHDMPWRQPPFDPYKILVSEIMLQQTQVSRVTPKFTAFLQRFPTASALAAAPLADVLAAWSGLGYNRRAKFLWQAAQQIHGAFPTTVEELVKLPGVGPNTAGAVAAYAFNQPAVFIETNIRTVFIHHFFKDQLDVPDSAILALVAETLPANPREWYWALMDYGAYLKLTVGNLNRVSKSYARKSRFAGSLRQLRGEVLRLLIAGPLSAADLQQAIADERLPSVLQQLEQEQLVSFQNDVYQLGSNT